VLSLIVTASFVSKSDNFESGCQKFNPMNMKISINHAAHGRSMNQIEIEALVELGFGKKRDKQPE